jgi:membrane dipeptidase
VSHLSDRAFWQVMELSSAPVVATHSSLRHFVPGFHRNMSDEMVAALGRNGGVVQINFGSSFVTAEARAYSDAMTAAVKAFAGTEEPRYDDPAVRAFAARYRAEHPYPYAKLEDVLNHVDRAVALAGIEHVGLGSDYDGVGDTLPVGLKDVSSYPNLIAGLAARGYDDERISMILGGNLMRVWSEVEAVAAAQGFPTACRHDTPARSALSQRP